MKCNRTYTHIAVVESTRTVTPCCQFSNYQESQVIDLAELASFNDVLESKQWGLIRNQIETGIADAHCNNCFAQERRGLDSSRTYYNRIAPNQTKQLQDIEIALDFTCNMACRICKPAQSSVWSQAKGLVETLIQFSPDHYAMLNAGKPYADNVRRLARDSDFSHIKRLRIAGGEPLYSKFFVGFLERVDADVGLQNVELFLNTNGSIIPTGDRARLLSKCKSLQIQLSIDAIGNLAEVIRPGIPWKQIEANVPKWIDFVASKTDKMIQIHPTFSIMNVNRIQELVDFATACGADIAGHKLFNPPFLSIDQLEQIDQWSITGNPAQDQFISQFNQMLRTKQKAPNALASFIQAMHAMDSHHGVKFSDANEEIWSLAHEQLIVDS